MPFEQGEAIPFVQPDEPARGSLLASIGAARWLACNVRGRRRLDALTF
jgi:hypothetical protein